MGAFTSRFSLYKPGGGSTGLIVPDEILDIDKLNSNFDIIDANLGAFITTSTTLPGVPKVGQLVFETDTKRLRVYSGGSFVAPATERGSLTMYTGTNLAALDALTDGVIGDTFYMTDPGLGNAGTGTIDPMTWEAIGDSGVNLNWRVRDQIVADTKAHLDTFIAAVAAIAGTDEQFRIGNRALVSTTRQSYIFRSTAGAYLIDATPIRMFPAGSAGITVDPVTGIATSTQQATLTFGTVGNPAFADPFTDYNVVYDLVGNGTATGLILQFLDAAGAPIAAGTLYDVYRTAVANSIVTSAPLMVQNNLPLSAGIGGASFRHKGRFSIRAARDVAVKLFESHEEVTAVPGVAATGGQISLDGVLNSTALLTGFVLAAVAGTFAVNELYIEAVPK